MWVDDIIIGDDNIHVLKEVKEFLKMRFKMKDLKELSWFLGIQFKFESGCIEMNQSKYVESILQAKGSFK